MAEAVEVAAEVAEAAATEAAVAEAEVAVMEAEVVVMEVAVMEAAGAEATMVDTAAVVSATPSSTHSAELLQPKILSRLQPDRPEPVIYLMGGSYSYSSCSIKRLVR